MRNPCSALTADGDACADIDVLDRRLAAFRSSVQNALFRIDLQPKLFFNPLGDALGRARGPAPGSAAFQLRGVRRALFAVPATSCATHDDHPTPVSILDYKHPRCFLHWSVGSGFDNRLHRRRPVPARAVRRSCPTPVCACVSCVVYVMDASTGLPRVRLAFHPHNIHTTIKVYARCLRPDIEYKTLPVTWGTRACEVVAALLRKVRMRHRDPRLFCLSMEVRVRRAGLRTALLLDDDARPAALQACHPKGYSKNLEERNRTFRPTPHPPGRDRVRERTARRPARAAAGRSLK
ncbi:hypothetical protein EVAR_83499_1 [Eumeta japonica]|uniref:Ras-associating domain-containing protein n=1 Tax=Eumeta variegata TaxID=151549 RepID=A0A4C1Y2I1_EUMVA|nr:hypothetical protein EVAR_83499_1 [Eumeta japonica]